MPRQKMLGKDANQVPGMNNFARIQASMDTRNCQTALSLNRDIGTSGTAGTVGTPISVFVGGALAAWEMGRLWN